MSKFSHGENLSGRARARPRFAKKAPSAPFLYASRPVGFESLHLRGVLARPFKQKSPHCWGLHFENGGGGGIRTLVTLAGQTVFETAAFNHSATPPHGVKNGAFGAGENLAESRGFEPRRRF